MENLRSNFASEVIDSAVGDVAPLELMSSSSQPCSDERAYRESRQHMSHGLGGLTWVGGAQSSDRTRTSAGQSDIRLKLGCAIRCNTTQ